MDETSLLDMLAVLDEERRYNEAAAVLAVHPARREQFARNARADLAVIRSIRQEMARMNGHRSRRHVKAWIDRLLELQIETARGTHNELASRMPN